MGRAPECESSTPLPWVIRLADRFLVEGFSALAGLDPDEIQAVLDVVAESAPHSR